MCDTVVILAGDDVFFGKNSDREPGEAQLVVRIPPVTGDRARKLRTTYIEVEQVPDRHGVLMSKPFWIWGAEMGANDRGVVIGNEAIFTRVIEKTPGLIGMDLLRLGLERGDSARHALEVITSLLERYGQGGVCGFMDRSFRYDNSFIIADPQGAWVLETAGRHWAAKKVRGYAAISNCLTIGGDYDLKSEGLEDFARRNGRLRTGTDFSFKKAFDTWLIPHFGGAHQRLASARLQLAVLARQERVGLADITAILRTHRRPDAGPVRGGNGDICMHAAGPLIRRSQTCGSLVSRLSRHGSLHLATGTSAPCLSIFKPVEPACGSDYYVLGRDGHADRGSLWRRFEPVHRRLLFFPESRREAMASRDAAEKEMLAMLEPLAGNPSRAQLAMADRIAGGWTERLTETLSRQRLAYPLTPSGFYWRRMDRGMGRFSFPFPWKPG